MNFLEGMTVCGWTANTERRPLVFGPLEPGEYTIDSKLPIRMICASGAAELPPSTAWPKITVKTFKIEGQHDDHVYVMTHGPSMSWVQLKRHA